MEQKRGLFVHESDPSQSHGPKTEQVNRPIAEFAAQPCTLQYISSFMVNSPEAEGTHPQESTPSPLPQEETRETCGSRSRR